MEDVLISQLSERPDQSFCFEVFASNHQIQHWFCGKTENGGAPDVFDPERSFFKECLQPLFFFFILNAIHLWHLLW
ncbi:hypothetical protein P9D51_18980 [Bacillus sonorensis]|nr:hypothetical protein [Bacillus sonorensis]MEC1353948.1 hypothetical protein [Bacillus sonorensis]MEC1428141.1 hypothetical protein [Bacillus sonorensis]